MGTREAELMYLSTFAESQNQITRVYVTKSDDQWFTFLEHDSSSETPLLNMRYSGYNSEQAIQIARLVIRERLHYGAEPVVPIHLKPAGDLPSVAPTKLYRHKLDAYSDKHADPTIFFELRKWRRKEASKSRLAPYLIASDRLLNLLAAFVPHTELELIQVPGIGDRKIEAFGERLLSVLAKFEQPESFPLDWVDHAVSDVEAMEWAIKMRDQRQRRTEMRKIDETGSDNYLLEMLADQSPWTEVLKYMPGRTEKVLNRMKRLHQMGHDVVTYIKKEVDGLKDGNHLLMMMSGLKETEPELFADLQSLRLRFLEEHPDVMGEHITLNYFKLLAASLELLAANPEK